MDTLQKGHLYAATAAQSGIARELLDPHAYPALIDRTVERLRGELVGQDGTFAKLGQVLNTRLAERFIGWDEAIRSLGITWDRRPLASLLAVGPTGVGKTETAKRLADALFGGRLIALNCTEVGPEARHATAMWTGSPPGYVGSDRGGILTDGLCAHRTAVILVDEIEKASPEAVQNILIPLMGEGTVTDRNNGQTLWATDCVVFATSNIRIEPEVLRHVGFVRQGDGDHVDDAAISDALSRYLLPEVIGRLNAVLCYQELDLEAQWKAWSHLRQELAERIGPSTRIVLDEAARRFIQGRFRALETGARGIRDLFREQVMPLVVHAKPGGAIHVSVQSDRLVVAPGSAP